MNRNFRASTFLRYAIAIFSVECAIVGRLQLDPILGMNHAYVTFYLAVLVTMAFGGWKPALLALVLGETAAAWFFVPPRYAFSFNELWHQIGLFDYMIICGTAIAFNEAQQSARRKAEESLDRAQREAAGRNATELEHQELLAAFEGEKNRLAAILQQMPMGVIVAEAPSGKLLFGNMELSRLLGRPFQADGEAGELGEQWRGFHPDGRRYERDEWPLMRAVKRGEVVRDEEIDLELPAGTTIQVAVDAAPVKDARGRTLAGIMTVRNITHPKAAELRLAESEEQYRSWFESNPDPVFLIDLQGRFVSVNPAGARSFGYTLEELRGMPFTRLCAPEQAERVLRHFAHAFCSEPDFLETALTTREGRRVDLFITSGPVVVRGKATGLLSIATDITEQKRTENRLTSFSQLGQSLSSVATPVEASRIIGDVAEKLFGWDGFSLCLCSPGGDEIQRLLQVETAHGQKIEVLPLRRETGVPPHMLRILQGGAELILRQEMAVQTRDSALLGGVSDSAASVMSVPIRESSTGIGVLTIESRRPWAYEESDLAILQSLADYCSGALKRIRAEEALRASEEEHRTLHNAVPAVVFSCTDEGLCRHVNQWWVHYTGLSEEQSLGRGWRAAIHPEDWTAAEAAWRRAREQAADLEFSYRLRRADGVYRWFTGKSSPLRDSTGRILKWLGAAIDIEDRKQAENALRESEHRFVSFMQHLPGHAWMKDAEGRYLYVNRSTERLVGKSLTEISGLKDADLFSPEVAEGFANNDRLVLANMTALQFLELVPSAAGMRFCIVSKFPIRGKNGQPPLIAGVAIDITERKRAEEALALSNRRLSLIAQVTNTVVGSMPLRDQVRQLAETVRVAYGVTACVVRLLEGQELVLLACAGWPEENLGRRIPADYGIAREIVTHRRPLGIRDVRLHPATVAQAVSSPFLSYAGAPLLGQDRILGIVGLYVSAEVRDFTPADLEQLQIVANHIAVVIVNDGLYKEVNRQKQQLEEEMAERQLAEEEIQRLNASLERRVQERTGQLLAANRELEAFCYSVSHDLRAPLRSIAGFAQVLEDDYKEKLEDDGRDCLHRVVQSSREMDQLIDDLLHLSRLTRSDLTRESVNLSDLVRKIADDLRSKEPWRAVEFVIAPGVTAQGDGRLLRIALDNLLSNAWKFTGKRAEGRIEFGVEAGGGEPEYFVRDNGAGFEMEHAGKLFGAFQRLHHTAEFPGHGIGLATVQRIVNRHGGRVRAAGELGRGATFYFTLPA